MLPNRFDSLSRQTAVSAGASTAPSRSPGPGSHRYQPPRWQELRPGALGNRGRLHWHTAYTAKLTGTHRAGSGQHLHPGKPASWVPDEESAMLATRVQVVSQSQR